MIQLYSKGDIVVYKHGYYNPSTRRFDKANVVSLDICGDYVIIRHKSSPKHNHIVAYNTHTNFYRILGDYGELDKYDVFMYMDKLHEWIYDSGYGRICIYVLYEDAGKSCLGSRFHDDPIASLRSFYSHEISKDDIQLPERIYDIMRPLRIPKNRLNDILIICTDD